MVPQPDLGPGANVVPELQNAREHALHEIGHE
jgi:hypothetical protein